MSTAPALEIVRPKDIIRIMGISKSTAYQMVKNVKKSGPKRTYLTVDEFAFQTGIPRDRIKAAL